MVTNIISKFTEQRNIIQFNYALSRIIHTSPIKSSDDSPVLILSQVHHQAVKMSLVAIKSFVKNFGHCKIELINDGSLTTSDLSLLAEHIQGVKIIDINEIDIRNCPKDGCWERLCYLLQRTEHYYVIQLDSDTVTLGPLPEIHNQIINNHGFTIGSPMFPIPVTLEYMSYLAGSWSGEHVQTKAEKNLIGLHSLGLTHYLRGCAAFTGFPKGSNLLPLLSIVSQTMENKLGKETWYEWGTEQFSSNVMLSFCNSSVILNWPKYQNHQYPSYEPKADLDKYLGQVSLVHFIGTTRFSNNLYTKLVKRTIEILK